MNDLRSWGRMGLMTGLVGLLLAVLGLFWAPDFFFRGWLWAWLFVLGLSMGSACVAMIHHLSGGRWGFVIRRGLEAAMAPMPWVALLFVPVFFGIWRLYPWSDPGAVAHEPALAHRSPYMNPAGFMVRSVVYLGVWVGLAARLRRLSADQMASPTPEPTWKLRRLSPPGLIVYVLLATLAIFDWVVSLDTYWYSSMFGALMCVGQLVSAYALALMLLPRMTRFEPLGRLIDERLLNQLGNLLLAFMVLWTYMAFGQFLIIWAGNLPPEIHWYLKRVEGGWAWVIGAVAVLHFFIPFAILLSRAAKRRIGIIQAVAAVLFFTQMLYQFWVVMPTAPGHGSVALLATVTAIIGIGGIWFWLFTRALAARPLLEFNDPRFGDG